MTGLGTVLGTDLFAVESVRPRTVMVSDLHIGAEDFALVESLAAVCSDASRGDGLAQLLILGDLFDAYLGPSQHGVGAFKALIETLRSTAAAGVSVTVIHGNRDFLLGAPFERATDCAVVRGGLVKMLDDRVAVLLHGDELCLEDRSYQRFKKIVRHPITRGLARVLPGFVVRRLAARARKGSAVAMAKDQRRGAQQGARDGQQASLRFEPIGAAVDQVWEFGELLVFGHIHRPARGRRGSREYLILPAFDETGVYAVADGDGLRYRKVGVGDVPDYPPRDFPG